MEYIVICTYCNHTETLSFKYKDRKCSKCNDKHLKYKEFETGNVFGYSEEDLEHFDKEKKNKEIDETFDSLYDY